MRPHLHFGIRAGQRSDYGSAGEWRWQAGWVKPCPADAGWLQPSAVINGQAIPDGGFHLPAGSFFHRLGLELLFAGAFFLAGLLLLWGAIKRNRFVQLFVSGAILFAMSWFLRFRGMHFSWLPMGMAAILLGVAASRFVRKLSHSPYT